MSYLQKKKKIFSKCTLSALSGKRMFFKTPILCPLLALRKHINESTLEYVTQFMRLPCIKRMFNMCLKKINTCFKFVL